MENDECLICRKQRGEAAPPPGGYIYSDEFWMICHAPPEKGPLGTLFVESRRHFLDLSELNDGEASTFAGVLARVYAALRQQVDAERIYLLSTVEGMPHFHAWIVPRPASETERSLAYLAKDLTCSLEQAAQLAAKIRDTLR